MGFVRLSAAAAILLILAGPALAEGKQDKIRALLKMTNATATATQMFRTTTLQLTPELQRKNPSVPPTAWFALRRDLDDDFARAAPELVEAMVPIYDRYFTEQELDDLIAFYSTPTGRKLLTVQPSLVQEGMAEGQKMVPQIAEKTVQKALIRIREQGYTR